MLKNKNSQIFFTGRFKHAVNRIDNRGLTGIKNELNSFKLFMAVSSKRM